MKEFDIDLGGCLIRIKANGTDPVIGDYVSVREVKSTSQPFRAIIVIRAAVGGLAPGLLKDNEVFRSGWALDGYYAGRYYGEKIFFRKIGTSYLVIGSDPSTFIWRYLVKYILVEFARENKLLHFKAACVAFNNRGCLIFGLSKSGKTTLVQALVSMGADFVSNTNTFLDPRRMIATGVHSNVRVRGDGYRESPGPEPSQSAESMRRIENVFPPERVRDQVEISDILFIQNRGDRRGDLVRVDPDDSARLLADLFIGARFYDLQHDIIEDGHISLVEYAGYAKYLESCCGSVAARVNSHFLPLSRISREMTTDMIARIWADRSGQPQASRPESAAQLADGSAAPELGPG